MHAGFIEDHQFAGFHIAHKRRADLIQCTGLAGHRIAVAELSDGKWTESVAVASCHHAVARHQQKAEGPLEFGQGPRYAARSQPVHRVSQQMYEDFAVRTGLEDGAGFLVHFSQSAGIDQIAVVRHGPDAVHAFHHQWLHVLDARRACGGIADMPDAEMSRQPTPVAALENLGDQSNPAYRVDVIAIAGSNASPFLSAMLQCKKPLIKRGANIFNTIDTAQPAELFRLVLADSIEK